MIAIKDMEEMPSGCDRCRLYPVCKHRDVYNDNYKSTDCPLVEIVTCKDCEHGTKLNDYDYYLCDRFTSTHSSFVGFSPDSYCPGAERRE